MNDVYHVLIFDCEAHISSEESSLLTSCNDRRVRHYKMGVNQSATLLGVQLMLKFQKVVRKINRKQAQFTLPG